jgi:hypothetical protein
MPGKKPVPAPRIAGPRSVRSLLSLCRSSCQMRKRRMVARRLIQVKFELGTRSYV